MILYETDVEKLNQIDDYILSNLEKNLKLDAIAQKFSMETHTLRRQFKVHKGFSVHRYVLTKRMHKAHELLVNKTMSVSEVSDAVGYRDVSTFSHAFSAYYGISPNNCLKCSSGSNRTSPL